MEKIKWVDRKFNFGMPNAMLPFFIERMTGTIVRLEAKVLHQNDEVLSNKLDDKWSIKENIGHLADVEEVSLKRVKEILSGVSPMSSAIMDLRHDYNHMRIDQVLAHLKKIRNENLQQYDTLSETDLQRTSVHPRLKVLMNPVDLTLFHAEHDDHHLVRINEILTHFKLNNSYANSKSPANI